MSHRSYGTLVLAALGAIALSGCDVIPDSNKAGQPAGAERPLAGVLADFISDNFDCAQLNENVWTFTNALGDGSTAVQSNGLLAITADASAAHGAYTDGYAVPRVMQDLPAGDVTLVARFDSAFASTTGVEQNEGLLIEESPTRFIRFDFSSFDGQSLLYAGLINVGGSAQHQAFALDALPLAAPVRLRATRTGADWEFAYAADDGAWTVLTGFTTDLVANRAGLYAGNSAGTGFTARADYLVAVGDLDCDANGNPDAWDLATNGALDCNGDGVLDACTQAGDCNTNGVDDADDIAAGTSADCNANTFPDECELAGNDCNANGVPDDCEFTTDDADADGVLDACDNCPDVANSEQADTDGDGLGDACDDDGGAIDDCNSNGVADEDDIAGGTSTDCDSNGVPDGCELTGHDCNMNGTFDACELAGGDRDGDGVLDGCDNCPDDANPDQADSDGDGAGNACDSGGGIDDCNNNGIDDGVEIAAGSVADCNNNGEPDACERGADCDANGTLDECELAGNDSDSDGVLDACDNCPNVANPGQGDADGDGVGNACDDDGGAEDDCNANGVDDADEIAAGSAADCNDNGVPDACELASSDRDGDGVLDVCDNCPHIANPEQRDTDHDGIGDVCDEDFHDCNDNGIPDECELEGNDRDDDGVLNDCDNCPDHTNADQRDTDGDGVGDACDDEFTDCNENGVNDATDIACGNSADCNENGIPDECEDSDRDGDGVLDACDNCPDHTNADQRDTDGDGTGDACDDEFTDCNENGVNDATDIACGNSADCNENGIPDECEYDGDDDGVIDACDDCPESELETTLTIGGCDSRVPNLVGETGCSMKDELRGCINLWPDANAVGGCLLDLIGAWHDDGLINFNELGCLEHCVYDHTGDEGGDD